MDAKHKITSTFSKTWIPTIIFWLSLLLITSIALNPLLDVRFTTRDDSVFHLLYTGDFSYPEAILAYMINAGTRPLFHPVMSVPYLHDSFVYFKATQILALLTATISSSYFIYKLTNDKQIALLYLVLFIGLLQNSWNHNILTSYPFYFHFFISLISLTLILLLKFTESGEKRFLLSSSIIWILVLFSYEMHIIYFLAICIIIYIRLDTWKERGRAITPYLALVVLFLMTDILLRIYFERSYSGTRFRIESLSDMTRTLIFYSSSSMPGFMFIFKGDILPHYYENRITVPAFSLAGIQAVWVIKSGLIAILSWHSLTNMKNMGHTGFYMMFAIFLYIFLPNLPLSFSGKYQTWSQGFDFHYVTTHYSYIAMIMFIVVTASTILKNMANARKMVILTVCTVFSACSIATDYTNHHVYRTQILSTARWDNVDALIKTDEFLSVPPNSVIYAPSLWTHDYAIMSNTKDYWSRYFSYKSGRKIVVTDNSEHIQHTESRPVYYLSFLQNIEQGKQFILLGKILDIQLAAETRALYASSLTLISTRPIDKLKLKFSGPGDERNVAVSTNQLDNNLHMSQIHGNKPFPLKNIQAKGYF